MSNLEQRSAGRELDAEVAEKVMGIAPKDVRVRGEVDTPLERVWNASSYWREDGRHDRYQLRMNADAPCYSTDIVAAWKVVEKLCAAHLMLTVNYSAAEPGWWCVVYPLVGMFTETDYYATAPLAICIAALEARPS